jgi:hypothetical protein
MLGMEEDVKKEKPTRLISLDVNEVKIVVSKATEEERDKLIKHIVGVIKNDEEKFDDFDFLEEIKSYNYLYDSIIYMNKIQLIKEKNYDIVIRNRTDIKFDRPLFLEDNLHINIPSGGDHRGGLLDLFAYGNKSIMEKYCSLFDNIENYINDKNILFHPESLLRHHCTKHNLKINRFIFDIYLRNINFTRTAPCVY